MVRLALASQEIQVEAYFDRFFDSFWMVLVLFIVGSLLCFVVCFFWDDFEGELQYTVLDMLSYFEFGLVT